uniref:chitin synthase n=1 Tax=Henosepilachna vigintioctopunctata TaxID=420089 RepID=A0A8F2YH22_9CUCU|nr:chitin synthase 2 [Henosepilachna vigintioctopunctata]
MNRRKKRFYKNDEETELLSDDDDKRKDSKTPLWDVFKDTPRKPDTGSDLESKQYDFTVKAAKILVYVVVFMVILCTAMLSKGTLFLMTSQVKINTTRPICNEHLDTNRKFQVQLPEDERVTWIWALIYVYFVPQIATFLRSLRVCLFKSWKKKNIWRNLLPLFVTESLPAIGSAILVFSILPELDILKAAMLTNAFCFIPGVVGLLSRNAKNFSLIDISTVVALDIVSIIAQMTSFIMWPILEGNHKLNLIPISAILISFGWWENYVDENASFPIIRALATKRRVFQNRTYFLYLIVSVTNCLIFFTTALVIFWVQQNDISFLFNNFGAIFSDRSINVTEVKTLVEDLSEFGLDDTFKPITGTVLTSVWTPITVILVNIFSSYICYTSVKFASKISIQEFSFALPINLTIPLLLCILIGITGDYLEDECKLIGIFPSYIFFKTPPIQHLKEFLTSQYSWAWLMWLLSQAWITIHIWNPKCRKLAKTEKLFVRPMYDAFLIDQSVCLNRRRDDSSLDADSTSSASNPRVFVCATMWHEIGEEMMTFLKSIFRLDEDHCAHRIVENYLHVDLPTNYELECNIFFDDAFIRKSTDDTDPLLNSYVLDLITRLDKAASEVHGVNLKIRPPKIFSTPYGGRLEWILPGRTKLLVHLKDKAKIRAKKRWSQVMYMYYLLGYRLMDNPEISRDEKTEMSQNTFLLALDGDIDFKPDAMHLLMEYMKINKKLGAACGRIHPVGQGAIAWYQIFEYAVGHWLQKATEHVVGCVLCSPGCFSLFRGEVLMQDRVMCKYTTVASEARHRVQYDQGEDRWLCTLILQAGYRVEYSAASDSYTHCPEGFNEFYNQRRRWIPSTMANILDVLSDHKNIVEVNDDISMIYIIYQMILLLGTVSGPGTIFLMLVGAAVTVFAMDEWTSFLLNLIPIMIFVAICALCDDKVQLLAAGIISSAYGLIMMAVMIGVILQIHDDGIMAPSSIFFFFMLLEFVVAAIIHPKEFYCLKYGIIYYVTVPSMYMLLMIFSVFNMNNVSWGTRDVTVVKTEQPEENKTEEKKEVDNSFSAILQKFANKENGSMELSWSGLFKCAFCTHPSREHEELKAIQIVLQGINDKLNALEDPDYVIAREPQNSQPISANNNEKPEQTRKESPTTRKDAKSDEKSPEKSIMSNSWFYHKELINGEVEWLDDREEKFWDQLIEKYLEPIDETSKQKIIARELKDLRDKMVFTFFMINALFVLVIFLLTLKKDIVHINWPYNPKVNFTYVDNENEVEIMKDYLHLEPIGFVFLISFASLLVIQSFGMFVHRFGTFSQILSNTQINWNIMNKKKQEGTKHVSVKNALRTAKKLQQLYDLDKNEEEKKNEMLPPGKRKSVFFPAINERKKPQVCDLVESFKARMKLYDDEGFKGPVDRKTVTHIKNKHSEILRKSQSHLIANVSE